jgi:hypothetical protein
MRVLKDTLAAIELNYHDQNQMAFVEARQKRASGRRIILCRRISAADAWTSKANSRFADRWYVKSNGRFFTFRTFDLLSSASKSQSLAKFD